MKTTSLKALSGILLERVFMDLRLAEIQIGNFGDILALNKPLMLEAKRRLGRVEAYLDVMKILFPKDHSDMTSREEYKRVIKLVEDTEDQLMRY